jgi:hypothetical protein
MDEGFPSQWLINLKARPPECEDYTVIYRNGTTRSSDSWAELGGSEFEVDEFREHGTAMTHFREFTADNGLTFVMVDTFLPIGRVLFGCKFSGLDNVLKKGSRLCSKKASAIAEVQGLADIKIALRKGERLQRDESLLEPVHAESGI